MHLGWQSACLWGQVLYIIIAMQLLGVIYVATTEELLELSCEPLHGEPSPQCKGYEHSGVQTKCVHGFCECTQLNISERVPCRPKEIKLNNIIGGPCPCAQLHAVCNVEEDICYCETDHVPSIDRRRCISVSVHLDNNCEMDSQCQHLDSNPFAYCHPILKQCICKPSYKAYDGKCRAILDSKCAGDADCGSCGAATCIVELGKCSCSDTHVPAEDATKCVSGVHFGEPCTFDAECQLFLGAGSVCHEKMCTCRELHYLADRNYLLHENEEEPLKLCIPRPVVGSYCRKDRECEHHDVEWNEQSMKCVFGECNCLKDFKTFDNIKCLRSNANTMVGNFIWAFCIFLVPLISV